MRRLLTHPRGCGFRYNEKKKIYHVASGRSVSGITKSNRRLFYPAYSYSRATKAAKVSHTFNTDPASSSVLLAPLRVDTASSSSSSSSSATALRRRSIRRGNKVDDEMGKTMRLFKKYRLRHSFFYDVAARDAWTTTVVPPRTRRYVERLQMHTRACWNALGQRDLVPVADQVVVGCTKMIRGTKIDLVCRDSANRFVVIELKSGFDNYYYNWTGTHMNAPFTQQTDCAFNQHQLQLLVGAELYRRSYCASDATKMGTPLLMRMRTTEDGGAAADVHPLRPWATDALPAAVRAMMTS